MARILAVLIAFLTLPISLYAEGSRWSPIGPYDGSVYKLAVDPLQPGVVYALCGEGVLKSLDSGNSWTLLAGSPREGAVLGFDPSRPHAVYASDSQQLYRSTDGGEHWISRGQGLPVPLRITSLAVDPLHPARLYLGAYGGGLWRSTDGGASWKTSSRGLPLGEGTSIFAVAAAGRPPGTALAITYGSPVEIFCTINGGYSWTPLANNAPAGYAWALAVAPSEPRTVYLSIENQGLYRSTDGGSSWTSASGNVPAFKTFSALAVDPRSAQVVYAGTTEGLMKTTNGGRSWEAIGISPSAFVRDVAVDPQNPDIVYVGVESGIGLGGVWRSRDAGRHWERRSQGILGLEVVSIAINPGDPRTLLVGGSPGLLRSTNARRRWTRIGLTPVRVPSVQEIVASPGEPGTFLVMARSLWKTTDNGDSWTEIPEVRATLGRVRFDPANPDTAYVMTRQQLFRGALGSSTWTSVAASPMPCGLVDFAVVSRGGSGPPILYVAGTGTGLRCSEPYRSQVLRSVDGGRSWASADAGLPGKGVYVLVTDPSDRNVLYTGIGRQPNDPVPGVWKSLDGGASWSPGGEELLGATIISLLALPTPGHVWAVTQEGRAFLSTDGGMSWQEQGHLQCHFQCPLALDPQDDRRIYAATSNGVWVREELP